MLFVHDGRVNNVGSAMIKGVVTLHHVGKESENMFEPHFITCTMITYVGFSIFCIMSADRRINYKECLL